MGEGEHRLEQESEGEAMKYIDAEKAKNGIMEFVNESGEIVGMFVNDFNILLERCAVDAQEVVRCRDCKYYLGLNERCELTLTRLRFYNEDKVWDEECYCCWGERKDG